MSWIVSLFVIFILIVSFLGGMKEGAVKNFFSFISLLIAIPLTGLSYGLIAAALSFLPGTNWENFVGFFITFAIFSVILFFIFLIPRKIIQKIWKKGCIFRLTGGVLNFVSSGIGMTVFALVLMAYPIFGWLERWVSGSGILMWVVSIYGFVSSMLPDVFGRVITNV